MKKRIIAGILLGLVGALVATADQVQVAGVQATQTNVVSQANAQTYIDQGKAFLKAHNLLSAREQFALAVAADETCQEANFLYGVTRIAAIYENGQSENTAALDSVKEIAELSGFTFTTYGLFDTHTATEPNGIAASTPDTGAVIDFLATKAIPEIQGALLNFAAVTDPNFSSDLGPTGIQEKLGTTIFADFADVQVIKAATSLFKCNLELLRVYDLNVNLPNLAEADTSQLMTYRGLLMSMPALLTPRDASRLDSAKSDLISFIDSFNNGVAAMKGRANANSHLFVIDLAMPNGVELSSSETADFQKALADVKASLSGPAVYSFVDPSSPAAQVDLSKFFNSAAPINLRNSLVDCTGGTIMPDVTFGGMFPLGLTEVRSSLLSLKDYALGVACSGYGAPSVALSSDSAYFNVADQVFPFIVANRGTANLTASISIQGVNAADFSLTLGTCTTLNPTLPPGTNCTVNVAFQPTEPGMRKAFLGVASNDPSELHSYVTLTGQSAYQPISSSMGNVNSIVADPWHPPTFYAATGNGVLKSIDGGQSWSVFNNGLPLPVQVNALVFPSSNAMYAATNMGAYKSANGGAWFAVAQLPNYINAMAAGSGILAAASNNTVYLTSDKGVTWTSSAMPDNASVNTLAVDTAHAGVVYAGTYNGLYKSSDSGVTWSAVSGTPRDTYNNPLGINSILITPSAMYAGSQGLFRSSDGGVTWSQVDLKTGYTPYIRSIATSPADPGTLFISDGWNIYRSTDSGTAWSTFASGPGGNLAVPDASWLLSGNYNGIYRLPTAAGQGRSFTLTAIATGNGTGTFKADASWLSLPAPECVNNSCTWTLPEGATVDLYPQPGAGSIFAGWSGCDKLEDATCRMTITGSNMVSAQFALDDRALAVSAYPAGGSYTNSVSVALITNKNVPVRYTLDGNDPNETSPLYDGPIAIQTSSVAKVLKFRGYDAAGPGPVVTETYTVTPAARFNSAEVTRMTLGNGTVKDTLNVLLATPAATMDGLTVHVAGPGNFSHDFSNADILPWSNNNLLLYTEFPSLLPVGVYTFTLRDASGNTQVRSDTHADVPAISPVGTSTIRFVRKSDNSYRISWGPTGDARQLYYRVRVNRASDHVPVYTSSIYNSTTQSWMGARKMELFEDMRPGIVTDGTAYEVRVEASDSDSTDSIFSRSNSAYVSFTPQLGDYNFAQSLFSYANVLNQVAVDGTVKVALMFSIANSNLGNTTPPVPTLAEVTGPNGYHTQFDLTATLLPGSTNYFMALTPPLPSGQYTFHVVANGVDNYANATLSPPVILPLSDQSTWKIQDLGNGSIRFSWAGADYSGALYYRVTIRDTSSPYYSYYTARLNQSSVDVVKSSLPSWVTSTSTTKQWRVEAYDGSTANAHRNRRDGPYVTLALPTYNPSTPVIGNFGIRNLTRSDGVSNLTHVWLGASGPNPIASLTVTGPNGFNRDLLVLGQVQTFLGGFYSMTVAGSPASGLYSFTATDSIGNQAVRYHYQPAAHPLPVVDFRTIHVDTDPNGDTRISWAPVAADVPLWYQVSVTGMNNLNSDPQMDIVYQPSPVTSASVVIPRATMASLPKPLMFKVRANDGSGNTTMNNTSQSVMVGINVPGYDYSVLADADADGFASDVDLNDNDRLLYPFSPPPPANAILTITPSTLDFGNTTVGSSSRPLSFTFTNNGPDSVTVYSADKTGSSSFGYTENSGTCPDLPHTFAPGESCTSGGLVFSPTSTGIVTGSEFITTNSGSSPVVTVTLNGTGVQPSQFSLTTNIIGNGSINNLTQTPLFVCTDPTCTGPFPAGSSFTLSATPSGSYLFSGWEGAACSVQQLNCVISSLNADTTVTATFTPIPLVRIFGRMDAFQSLQGAFDVAAANDVVKARNILFTEGLVFNHPFGIKLRGGLASDFLAINGSTEVKGSLTVKSGSLTIENLVIY